MNWKIPLFKTYWDESDVEAVTKVIRRGTFWAVGPEIAEFEEKLAEYVGSKYVVTFNSGTSALHSVLLAHDITKGEVIVPSFTFIATANCVVLAGAKPVFAESESETFAMEAEDVKERITNKTRAVVPIHYGGCPARDSQALREICDDHDILLIEDAAESLGSKIGGKKVGRIGESAMFSLCQNKVITAGEGGFVVTDSERVYNKMKLIRSHGRVEKNKDYFSTIEEMDYIQVGYNYRLPTMSAALGLNQLEKIDDNIQRRRSVASKLDTKLADVEEIGTPSPPKDYFHVYQMYTIKLPDEGTRNGLQNHLTEKGIMSRVYFDPLHLKSLYAESGGYKKGDLPKTEQLSRQVLTIPMYPGMPDDEIEVVTNRIREYFR
ncbi:MAG: DegT/DnrJ/EryC1/StrS family aminotransferase [Methanobacteriota archaeon]